MSKMKLILAIIFLCTVAVSCTSKIDDNKIQEDVSKYLMEDQHYQGISSSTKDGIVTLSGTCEGENCSETIETSVKNIDGVKKVKNNIRKDNSTDLTLRTSVQSIITKYPGVQADVAGGVIVLRGSIDRENLQSLMSDLSTLHPGKIDNQLVIK